MSTNADDKLAANSPDIITYEWIAEYYKDGVRVRLIERTLIPRYIGMAGVDPVLKTEFKTFDFSSCEIQRLIKHTYSQLSRFSAISYYARRRRQFGSTDYRVRWPEGPPEDSVLYLMAHGRMETFLFDEISRYDAPFTDAMVKAINF